MAQALKHSSKQNESLVLLVESDALNTVLLRHTETPDRNMEMDRWKELTWDTITRWAGDLSNLSTFTFFTVY